MPAAPGGTICQFEPRQDMLTQSLFAVGLCIAVALVGCGAAPSDPKANDVDLEVSAQIDPDPPRVTRHTLTLRIEDLEGAPVVDAMVTAHAEMPLHAHASNEVAKVVEGESGEYRLSPVTFTMPGRWQVHVVIATDDGEATREFTYEVE
jgi:hypothetical protein